MTPFKIFSLMTVVLLMYSCTSQKHTTMWVSGMKADCNMGAGQGKCLQVHKGEDLANANWENFAAKIDGFTFEEGYFKKIEVKEEKIDNPPADGSSIKYTLVKEIEKTVDNRLKLGGKWMLATMNDNPIDRSIKLPILEIDLNTNKVGGIGGCNNYNGSIESLTGDMISFGAIGNTRKACIDKNIEKEYFATLAKVKKYDASDDMINFYDGDGNKLLSFIPKSNDADKRIHDIWTAIRISGNPINRMTPTPRLEINLTEMTVMGTDGCNDYTGKLISATDTELNFGNLALTNKMCRKMETAEAYNKAMQMVKGYKLDGLNLILTDENGEEVLAFLKAD